jgi:hypothetical protein
MKTSKFLDITRYVSAIKNTLRQTLRAVVRTTRDGVFCRPHEFFCAAQDVIVLAEDGRAAGQSVDSLAGQFGMKGIFLLRAGTGRQRGKTSRPALSE